MLMVDLGWLNWPWIASEILVMEGQNIDIEV